MKKTITLIIAMIALSAPLAWGGGGGGCEDSSCHDQGQQEQSPTGTVPEVKPTYKATPRSAEIDDFVVGERAVEKDSGDGDGQRSPDKLQPEMRAPEKKYSDNCN